MATSPAAFPDHGEELMDHGSVGHGTSLYNEVIHVPLSVLIPGQRRRIDIHSVVSVIDIAPTVQSQLPAATHLPIIDTVERVQGLTVEVVVVSLCASDPAYIASVAPFLSSANRLNVAISRARTKAILVASSALADLTPSEPNPQSHRVFWQRLLEMASCRTSI